MYFVFATLTSKVATSTSKPSKGRNSKGRNSKGRGVSKAKICKGKYEAKLEFPEGWGVQTKKKTLWKGTMDIFWGNNNFITNMILIGMAMQMVPRKLQVLETFHSI